MTPALSGRLPWPDLVAAAQEGRFGPVWIRSAAIVKDGQTYEGPRHNVIIRVMARDGHKLINSRGTQGFVTNEGQFLDRKQARDLARSNGQVTRETQHASELSSEDLWAFNEHTHADPTTTVQCYPTAMNSTPDRVANPLRTPLSAPAVAPARNPSVDAAHMEGQQAGYDHKKSNPHAPGTPEHAAFEEGFRIGEFEYRDRRREMYEREPRQSRDAGLDY